MKIYPTLILFLFTCFTILTAQDTSRQSLIELGNQYFEKSELLIQNYDSCIYYTKMAQRYYEQAQAWQQYVDCYNGLTTVYYWKNDFENYKDNANRALQAADQYLDKNSRPYAYAINNLGIYHIRKGDYNKAIELYRNATTLLEAAEKPNDYITRTYKNIGKAYQYKRDYHESIKYYQKVIAIRSASQKKRTSSFANDLLTIARNYRLLHQTDSALHYAFKSLNALENLPKTKKHLSKQVRINTNQLIAELFLNQEKADQARPYINNALSYQKEEDAYDKHISNKLLARYALLKGDWEEALNYYAKALESPLLNHPTSPDYRTIAQLRRLAAQIYEDHGQLVQALRQNQIALQNISFNFTSDDSAKNPAIDDINFTPEALNILAGKAATLMLLHQQSPSSPYLLQAYDCFQLIKQLIRQLRQDFLATGSKHLLAEKVAPLYEAAIENALLLYQQNGQEHYLKDAFNSAENNKAILLLESLNESVAKKSAGIPDSLLSKEYDLTIDLAFYEKKINLEKQKGKKANTEHIQQWETLLFDKQTLYQELISQLEKDFPLYYQLKYTDATVQVEALQKQLSAEECLLEYFIGQKKSYGFVINQQGITVKVLELGSTEWEAINQLRSLISQPPQFETAQQDFEAYLRHAHALYLRLIAPAFTKLPQQLILIPDALLSYLPFELLLTQADQSSNIDYRAAARSYLLQSTIISYDYSASLWYTNQQDRKATTQLKPFAGFAPTFSQELASADRVCTDDQLYSLKCSQQEIQSIQQNLGGDLYMGIQAAKTSFQEQAAQYRILHLATHACTDEQNPMLNKIHFTDDYLSNYDLSTLDLQAELAVLSACNTGTGKLQTGEGVMSLARNFTQAGCRSTVMSLWSVNDCSTSEVMTFFYQGLAEGKAKHEALRDAKLSYLESASKLERSPYYWAAFVQLGNSEALQINDRDFSFLWFIPLAVILLLSFLQARRQSS